MSPLAPEHMSELAQLVKTLERLPFYEARLGKVISSQLGKDSDRSEMRLDCFEYILTLIKAIPQDRLQSTLIRVRSEVICRYEYCPQVVHLRPLIAEAALVSSGVDGFRLLYELSKRWISLPPREQAEAETWIGKVIFSAITAYGRENFLMGPEDRWSCVATDVILGEKPLMSFKISEPRFLKKSERNFSSLNPSRPRKS